MKINKDTWHYKFWRKTFDYDRVPKNTNLCSYCQRIFWYGMFWVLFALMMAILVGGMLYFIFFIGFWQHTKDALIVSAVFAAILGAIAGVFYLNERRKYSEPTIFGQWVSAKKRRVCPLIEFDDKK